MSIDLPKRDDAITAKDYEIEYNYFMYLCDRAGLNGFPGNREKMKKRSGKYADSIKDAELLKHLETDCKDIDAVYKNRVTYFDLARKLYSTTFTWPIAMDYNRATDGEQLRLWYAELSSFYSDYKILEAKRCSVLEMMIAFSERIENDVMGRDEDAPDRSDRWFWLMLFNLGIGSLDISDAYYDSETDFEVESVLNTWLNREFDENGTGSPFPLKNPKKDQRTVELWYQMHAYFDENPQYFEQ